MRTEHQHSVIGYVDPFDYRPDAGHKAPCEAATRSFVPRSTNLWAQSSDPWARLKGKYRTKTTAAADS